MKKLISLALVTVMLLSAALGLCSCGKKVNCTLCGEEGREGSMAKKEVFGQMTYTCKDCQEDLEELGDLFN